ncbi:MAG: DEAD/DEAH box helicase [Sandaracinaceae bacterium]
MTASDSPLGSRIPASSDPDALLEAFLDFTMAKGLDLYPAQEEAILELFSGRSVILNTPTGSGKSLVASALCFAALARGERCFYTAPIKALVSEKFFSACRDFGAENVGMMTGDASVNRDAPIVCCTAEILANMALRDMEKADVQHVVMDEFHYYADRDRGTAWQVPLLVLPQTRFLLMSATLGDVTRFENALSTITGEEPATVKSAERPVPLDFVYAETPIQETVQELLEAGKDPIYIVHFTQRSAAETAQAFTSLDVSTREQKDAINKALAGFRFDTPFGKDLRRWVRHGIGVHHAGLLPKYRLLVEKLAQDGMLRLICGTDTLGVGVNVPIRTVLFTKLCKYDGRKTGVLTVRDFKQIAGRAGRKGFDDQGSVVCQAPEHVIENLKSQRKAGGDPKKLRKMRMKKPPERGYAHWDNDTFQRLIASDPERLESSFAVSHGMLLSVMDRPDGDGCRRMKQLVRASHDPPRLKYQNGRTAISMLRSMLTAGVVEITKENGHAFVDVSDELQEDFSLNHALSLYVVAAVEALDPESETYAFDVISLVEATLEDPNAVLRAQLNKRKGDKVAELKAAGMEYDERMEELEKVDIDRPNLELIQHTFEFFREHHPWVAGEAIRPKSVAREMLEHAMGFREYIKEYGLSRSEGGLLRYLSNAYKALVQNVPEKAKDDLLYDLTDELGAVVRGIDSSLIDEWEKLTNPDAEVAVAEVNEPTEAPDITRDRRGFTAMVRNAMARLLRAFSLGRFEEAAEWVKAPEGQPAWTMTSLELAMKPYYEEHDALRYDPGARNPKHMLVTESDGAWHVRQVMVDPEEMNDWSAVARFDLAACRDAGEAVLELESVGPSGDL